jgi:hypothetical protein
LDAQVIYYEFSKLLDLLRLLTDSGKKNVTGQPFTDLVVLRQAGPVRMPQNID